MRKNVFLAALIAFVFMMVAGSSYAGGKIGVPKTGETANYGAGSDGALQKGVAWPSPRFTDNLVGGVSNGTVTDNLTGLIWLMKANCLETVGGIAKAAGTLTWANALLWSNALANGSCSLTDGSTAGDWRLPGVNELEGLIDASKSSPTLPTVHPFLNVQSSGYWSSTTSAVSTGDAWGVDMGGGGVGYGGKLGGYYVWPVRGGQ